MSETLISGIQIMAIGMGVVFLTLYLLSLMLRIMEAVFTGRVSGGELGALLRIRELIRGRYSRLWGQGEPNGEAPGCRIDPRDVAVVVSVTGTLLSGRDYRILSISEISEGDKDET